MATIDFVGKIDGEEFEGGTSEGYEYVLVEGSMIDGFDAPPQEDNMDNFD